MNNVVDTNVFLDILNNTEYAEKAIVVLEKYKSIGQLVINEIIFGELASFFNKQEDMELFLKDNEIIYKNTTQKALISASQEWRKYLSKRKIVCTECGHKISVKCEKCFKEVSIRQHLMSDFIIGSFSLTDCDQLITRDIGYYNTYFKRLKTINY